MVGGRSRNRRFAAALGIHEGVDPSASALVLAKERGIDVCAGVAEHLPYSAAIFDGILVVTALCFFDDAELALREFARVLKPGGRLVIGMLPASGPWGRLRAEKKRQGHPLYAHARFFTAEEVRSLAERSGFRVDRVCCTLLSLPEAAPSPMRTIEIVPDAGFVCLRLVNTAGSRNALK